MSKSKRNRRKRLISFSLILAFSIIASSFFASISGGLNAATTTQKESLKAELKYMIESGDTSSHDISKYNVTHTDLNIVWNELITGESIIAYNAAKAMYTTSTKEDGLLKTTKINNIDVGFQDRYQELSKVIEIIQSNLSSQMNDLDKVLYIYEYLKNNTTYANTGSDAFYAFGPLVYNKAVCNGYAKAIDLLLTLEGIESNYVYSRDMNHIWNYVKLDGSWYHLDATWDDTGEPTRNGLTRTYLLRNDNEFKNELPNTHYNWMIYTNSASTSATFSNWFVHDIKGKMFYYDGYWYYTDSATNSILKNNVNGTDPVTILSLDTTVQLTALVGNQLTFLAGSSSSTIELPTVNTTNTLLPVDEIASPEAENNPTNPRELSSLDLNNFNNWRSGNYDSSTGLYKSYSSRLCLDDYIYVNPDANYLVSINSSRFRVLIREMSSDNKMIKSYNLSDNGSFTTSASTTTVGISLYDPSSSAITQTTYEIAFTNGLDIEINCTTVLPTPLADNSETDDTNASEILLADNDTINSNTFDINLLDLSDFANWRTGNYNYTTGRYATYSSRICLDDYILAVPSTKYTANVSDSNLHVLVREIDSNSKLIASHNLKSGSDFTTNESTYTLGISVYDATYQTKSYTDYLDSFNNGLRIELKSDTTLNSSNTSVTYSEEAPISDSTITTMVQEASQSNLLTFPENESTITTATALELTFKANSNTVDFNDFSEWRSGNFDYKSGLYRHYSSRICLNDYVNVTPNTTFEAISTNLKQSLLVREMDENMNLISSHNLRNGKNFTTSKHTVFLGISIYNYYGETESYDSYADQFKSGFESSLITKN